jgi:hypothetical protein
MQASMDPKGELSPVSEAHLRAGQDTFYPVFSQVRLEGPV